MRNLVNFLHLPSSQECVDVFYPLYVKPCNADKDYTVAAGKYKKMLDMYKVANIPFCALRFLCTITTFQLI